MLFPIGEVKVAIALTVYGIETADLEISPNAYTASVAIALTVYGIETYELSVVSKFCLVAIALTVYGIETHHT